jgi:ParB-like chromosome segregation protein Spo0J
MPSRNRRAPRTRRIPLRDLLSRPARANVLGARARRALTGQISRHGWYPPLIVRPHPRRKGKYEILDGHCRKEILLSLGRTTARCEVWPAGDVQARELAATLNRLRGRAETRRRAREVRALVSHFGREDAAARLGITPKALQQQLAALTAPRPVSQQPDLDLHAVVFHVSAAEAEMLQRALRRIGGGTLKRREALMEIVRRWTDGARSSGR